MRKKPFIVRKKSERQPRAFLACPVYQDENNYQATTGNFTNSVAYATASDALYKSHSVTHQKSASVPKLHSQAKFVKNPVYLYHSNKSQVQLEFETQMQQTLDKFPSIKVEMRYQEQTTDEPASSNPKPPKAGSTKGFKKFTSYKIQTKNQTITPTNQLSKTVSGDFFKYSSKPD